MLIVYQAIGILIALLVAAVTLRERNPGLRITGSIVLVLFLLRIFLIK
jgi:hypothetical protein